MRAVPYSDDRHRVLRAIRERRELSIADRVHGLFHEASGTARWSAGPASFEITPSGAALLQLWDYRVRQAAETAAEAAR